MEEQVYMMSGKEECVTYVLTGGSQKEKSFYDRIKRYRADPSTSTLSNPIPDYYGEKIGSVQDYRKWLKDQRAFSLKSKKDLL
jgi:import inner membrane translocase subunit TIM23